MSDVDDDGWDDDDDQSDINDNLDVDKGQEETPEDDEGNDGGNEEGDAWSFQDKDMLDDSSEKMASPSKRAAHRCRRYSFEDDDLVDQSDSEDEEPPFGKPKRKQPKPFDRGNDDDDFSFQDDVLADQDASDNDDQEEDAPAVRKKQPSPVRRAREQEIVQSLVSYLESLPKMLPTLNAVLEAEYNTSSHAMELVEYYASRPQLRENTLETELPQMDYEVVLGEVVLRDKQEIHDYLSQREPDSVLVRCANQSLLPDVLTVLTGPDLFIRPQILASVVAQSCCFTLHPPDHVVCSSCLHLSLPKASDKWVDVARLEVSIRFDNQTPTLEYRLDSVELLIPLAKAKSELHSTAQFLASMDRKDADRLHAAASAPATDKNLDKYRDAFMVHMKKAHGFVEATNTRVTSAPKEIDSAANVSKKNLDFIKMAAVRGMLLPTSDQITSELEKFSIPTTTQKGPPTAPPPVGQGSPTPVPPS